jgi:FkbM family methyltransferase
MDLVFYPNDNNTFIITPNGYDNYNRQIRGRPYHEFIFRKISEYIIKYIFGNNKNIIDLGAWIGDNSLPWAKMLNQLSDNNDIVYAIDPSDDNTNYIKALCQVNNIGNLSIIKSAISDKEEIVSSNDDINHCSFTVGNQGKNVITTTSLDGLYNDNKIKNIGYIHLDVEGMELKVLEGSIKLINDYRPIIAYEVHTSQVELCSGILKFMNSVNYTSYIINEVLPGCNYDCRNCLAIPNEMEPEIIINNIQNYINQGKYYIISHHNKYCYKSIYNNLVDAVYAFTILNGGGLATILYDVEKKEVVKQYGEKQYTNICSNYAIEHNGGNMFTKLN